MRLVLRLLGMEVLDLDLSDSTTDPDADLSGGTLSSDRIGFHVTAEVERGEDE